MKVAFKINGRAVSKRTFSARTARALFGGRAPGGPSYGEKNPLVSEAAGVSPADAASHQREIDRSGIRGVRVRSDGAIEFAGRRNRAAYLKARGYADRSGGYVE